MSDLAAFVKNEFPGKKIVILGDLVADQFLHGTISRVSREAPVFILRHDETETLPGGAANAAVNIASLGGIPALVGLIGNDGNGELLSERLVASGVNCGHLVSSASVTTTTKIRVLAGQHYAARQQVIRIDYENRSELDVSIFDALKENLSREANGAAAIVVSDYGYGVATTEMVREAQIHCKNANIPLLIDSRFRLADFRGAATATPNQDEVEAILGKDFTDADCEGLRNDLGLEALLVTCGNDGMLLTEKGESPHRISAVGGLEPVDVTGAGDTVMAAYSLGLGCGLSFADAARIANHAGGLVVMKKGTASVSIQELTASLSRTDASHASEAHR